MPRFIFIIGMHRSGTSAMAEFLRSNAVWFGRANQLMGAACSNLRGHNEHLELVDINDSILASSGGSWRAPPAQLIIDASIDERIQRLLSDLGTHELVGLKDPRLTLTWPFWKKHAADHRLIGCFRQAAAVARSLEIRDGLSQSAAVQLWRAYNEQLLALASSEPALRLHCFDEEPDLLAQRATDLLRWLGVVETAPLSQTFNPYLRHHTSAPEADDASNRLYTALLEHQRSVPLSDRPRAHATPDQQLAQLSDVINSQNEAIQRLARQYEDLLRHSHHELRAARQRDEQLAARLERCLKRPLWIDQLKQTAPVQLVRRLWRALRKSPIDNAQSTGASTRKAA